MYIGGEWIDSASGETFDRISPVTGEILASLPRANREDAQAAIDSANRARSRMACMPVFERAAQCHAIADVLESKHKSMGEELSSNKESLPRSLRRDPLRRRTLP